jgi:hypothetical protein
MSAPSDCSICYEAVIDFPASEATGSHRSSCGHLFHPKCIAKWHIRQEESTCPMCRKVATELEDCAIEEEEDEEDDDDDEDDEEEELPGEYGTIQIPRLALDALMRQQGGIGVTSGVMAEVLFDEFDEVTIWRYELERILREQGGARFSDAQWDQLQSVYPAEDEDDEPVAAVMAPLQLTFAPLADEQPDPTQRARELLANPEPPASVVTPEDVEAWELVLDSARATIARHAAAERHQSRQHPCPMEFFTAGDIPPTYGVAMSVPCDICKTQKLTIPFYHCNTCQFDICAECFMPPAAPAPGPFDAGEPHRFTFRRADIQRLLETHGSTATVEEFFNEDMGGGEEETLVVTVTLESLNNRFASLGATPVPFMEAAIVCPDTRHVVIKQRTILNPEDE